MQSLATQEKELVDKAEEAKKIGAVYKLLSRVFIREVDAPFLRQLRTGCFCESLKGVGIDFGDEFQHQNEEALLEELAVEYARLFIVPGKAIPPYESVWCEERFMGNSTQAVKDFYRRCGIKISDETLMPDHIGLELELMGYLIENKNELAGEFMKEHLGKWAPQFFSLIEKEASHPFYKEMAKLGKRLLEIENEEI